MSTDSLSCQDIDFPISHESPEDQLIVLSRSQLSEIIRAAVHQALDEVRQNDEERLEKLSQVVQDLQAENSALKRELDDLATWAEELEENQFIHAKLIADLRKTSDPQPMQRDRGEVLRALLVANGGKIMLKEARQKMHISRSRFSELLATMTDEIEVKPFHRRKNQRVLILK